VNVLRVGGQWNKLIVEGIVREESLRVIERFQLAKVMLPTDFLLRKVQRRDAPRVSQIRAVEEARLDLPHQLRQD
jgi:hypothetical protein